MGSKLMAGRLSNDQLRGLVEKAEAVRLPLDALEAGNVSDRYVNDAAGNGIARIYEPKADAHRAYIVAACNSAKAMAEELIELRAALSENEKLLDEFEMVRKAGAGE